MTDYALVGPNGAIERFGHDDKTRSDPIDPKAGTRRGWKWYPITEVLPGSYDPETMVLTGEPRYVVKKTKGIVEKVWSEVAAKG